MSEPQIITKHGLRILCIAEIRGKLSLLNKLAKQYNASLIIHTGNFGFFDDDSINRIHESYLRHIAAFSPLLDEDTIGKISELSKASGEFVEHLDENGENLKKILSGNSISELSRFLTGELTLNIPVYTIYGMVEDLFVINKFRTGEYKIPNLHIIDENNTYHISTNDDSCKIFLCGIGGSLTLHKLFNQGTNFEIAEAEQDDEYLIPASGDPGNMWITMVQIGKLIKTVEESFGHNDVRIFVSHPSPSREGLLGHLAVYLKMDYTISNGLHFLYPTSCNELSICPSFEYYKSKFSDARGQLAILWKSVRDTIGQMVEENPMLTELITLALDAFDRIPVSRSNSTVNEEITPLTLPSNQTREINSTIIRQQNDSYYVSFQNMWHFNLCDVSAGLLLLNVMDGKFKMECFSEGFDFSYRKNAKEESGRKVTSNSSGYDNSNGSSALEESPRTEKIRYQNTNRGSGGRGGPINGGYRGRGPRTRGAPRGRGYSRGRAN